MTDSSFLQAFLLINVFVIGALSAVAIRHAYAHFRPTVHEVEKPKPTAQTVHLPPEVKAKLLEAAEQNFQKILDRSAADLQQDLRVTAEHLNMQLDKLGSSVVSNETERYHAMLEELRKQAETAMDGAQSGMTKHREELETALAERRTALEAKLVEDVAAEQQRLTQQIDTKLGDAVAAFLVETLQHDVDLGAQSPYLISMLEEHKAEIAKGISNES